MGIAEAKGPIRIALALGATLAAMACFQVGAAFAKGLFPAVGPQGAAALRIVLAAAMLLLATRPWRAWPARTPAAALLGFGASMAAAVTFFYMAIERLPLGVAIALQFVGPLSIAVLGSRRPVDLVWAALAAAGVWLLVGVGAAAAPTDPLGVLFALGAAAGWAGYILCGRASTAFGAGAGAVSMAVAAILVVPVGLVEAGTDLFSPRLLPLALLVALFSTAIPVSLELYALPRLPPRTFAVFTSIEPVFGALAGLAILGERLSLAQATGVAAVIVAAAGAAWSSAQGARRERASLSEAPPG